MSDLRTHRVLRYAATALVLVLVGVACGKSNPGPKITRGGTFRVELSEPGSLDPNQSDNSENIIIAHQCSRGLYDYDNKTAKIVPAVAERFDVNANATEFTFHLRSNAKFSNGEAADAAAFVRGWSYATSKAAASPVAYHLAGVKGYADQQKGTTKQLAGVVAVDPQTFKVTLTAPDADFVVRTGHPVFAPRPSDAAVAAQKPSYAEFPLCDGPFKFFEAAKHNQSVTLIPNENYYGAKPFLDKVVYKLLADFDTAYTEWSAGNLDWTRIPGGKIKEAKAANANKFIIKPVAGINYLSMNVNSKPTDNLDFRIAVSEAIDRVAISNAAFAGLQIPSTGIIPPALPGYRAPVNGIGACKFCSYNVTDAKAHLAAAKAAGVDVSKPILLSFNGGAGHEVWMQAVSQELITNLGLKTTLKAYTPFGTFIKFRNGKDANGLMRNAWGMDYPTPDNFLFPLFDSKSDSITAGGDNSSHFNSPAMDKLVDQARSTPDAAARLKLYQDAEDIVLAGMPIVPLWWRTQFRLAALNKFGGLSMNAFEEPTVETAFQLGSSS